MNFNFTWLEDFLALAATGNFSRAAQERHSSQPAFSRRVRALEEWLGAPLVDRSTQPARLTEAGEWFRGVAQDLVARAARLPGEARQVAQARSATLRIASTHALSFTFLPRWLRSLEARLALGPVELASDVLARCEAQMQEGKVHFVLAHAHPGARGPLDSHAYRCARIGGDQLVPVSRPGAEGGPLHRLENGPAQASVPLLAYTDESGMGRVVRSVLGGRLEVMASHVVFSAHLASVLRSMALDGRGIAWLPRTLVEEDLAAGRLVAAAAEGPWAVDLEIRLYRQRDAAGRAAEAFWEAAVPSESAGP
ncbi:LysR substrate-binding domain-containing protein [Ramlibacter tataouinensis]|uniref:LysR substrate-binding domain-containing protein n=1 Tax=Ramlibacter tataouinensis TaxID=94132 RepID=UPI0022F3E691|nr:LysR substrate-binding domain-containing protein [Ramlibacter tataouinensis]WBY02500.1 LysR substrate-binding domain-containing protein [Ramlibacter tataouinensis]